MQDDVSLDTRSRDDWEYRMDECGVDDGQMT